MMKPFLVISLDDVLTKYWELANLDVEKTKGSITGQLKALDCLCEQLALRSAKQPAPAQRPQGMYRSAWMDEPGIPS